MDDGEAQPEASVRPFDRLSPLHERIEERGQHLGRNPDAVVADVEPHQAFGAPALQRDGRTGLAELRRIGDEVRHHLCEALGVGVHGESRGRHTDIQGMQATLDERRRLFERARHHGRQFHGMPPQRDRAARDARDVQEVFDHARQVMHLPLEHVLLRSVGAAHAHHLERGEHRGQRIPQFVAEHGEEVVLAPHGLAQRVLRLHGLEQADRPVRVELQQPVFAIGRPVRLAKVRGDHAQDRAARRAQRRRLHRTVAGAPRGVPLPLERRLRLHVGDDHRGSRAPRPAGRRLVAWPDGLQRLEDPTFESAMGEKLESVALLVVQLQRSHIGPVQLDGGVEDFVERAGQMA